MTDHTAQAIAAYPDKSIYARMSEVSELALTIARWDNTFDGPETNRIPPWAINLAQAIIDSEWLAKRDLKPQDSGSEEVGQ